jgi:hypothetical protein
MVDKNVTFKFKLRKACCRKFQKLKVAFGERAVGRVQVFGMFFLSSEAERPLLKMPNAKEIH